MFQYQGCRLYSLLILRGYLDYKHVHLHLHLYDQFHFIVSKCLLYLQQLQQKVPERSFRVLTIFSSVQSQRCLYYIVFKAKIFALGGWYSCRGLAVVANSGISTLGFKSEIWHAVDLPMFDIMYSCNQVYYTSTLLD